MSELVFLSDEWIAALDAAVRTISMTGPPSAPVAVSYCIGDCAYHLVLDAAGCSARAGMATASTVTFTMSAPVASAVALGRRPSSVAILAGEIAIGGDATQLVPWRPALDQIEDRLHRLVVITRFD